MAYPHLADNPIPRLLKLIGELTAAPLDHGSDFFPPSNLEVVSVDVGNPVFNLIPAQAAARFNVRFNDHFSLATLKSEIIRRIDGAGLTYDLEFQTGASQSFLTAPGPFTELVAGAVEEVTGATARAPPPRAAPRMRASSRTSARWWNSASWAAPCTRWTRRRRWRTSKPSPPSMAASSPAISQPSREFP